MRPSHSNHSQCQFVHVIITFFHLPNTRELSPRTSRAPAAAIPKINNFHSASARRARLKYWHKRIRARLFISSRKHERAEKKKKVISKSPSSSSANTSSIPRQTRARPAPAPARRKSSSRCLKKRKCTCTAIRYITRRVVRRIELGQCALWLFSTIAPSQRFSKNAPAG